MPRPLSAYELRKREWRAGVFIDKLVRRSPFELLDGTRSILTPTADEKEVIAILQSGTNAQLNDLEFLTEQGKIIRLRDLAKNAEFGGKGERSTLAVEDREVSSLQQQLEAAKHELRKSAVPIRVGNKLVHASDVASTPGTPKSDMHLLDLDGKEVLWISHKAGSKPTDFQQWAGMTESAHEIFIHPESKAFIEAIRKKFPKGLPNATTIARRIRDARLKKLAIYGVHFGRARGRENVDIVLQGPIRLERRGNYYTLEANHVLLNGELPDEDYDPTFMAIYKGDRSNFGVPGTRFGILPLKTRKVTAFI